MDPYCDKISDAVPDAQDLHSKADHVEKFVDDWIRQYDEYVKQLQQQQKTGEVWKNGTCKTKVILDSKVGCETSYTKTKTKTNTVTGLGEEGDQFTPKANDFMGKWSGYATGEVRRRTKHGNINIWMVNRRGGLDDKQRFMHRCGVQDE